MLVLLCSIYILYLVAQIWSCLFSKNVHTTPQIPMPICKRPCSVDISMVWRWFYKCLATRIIKILFCFFLIRVLLYFTILTIITWMLIVFCSISMSVEINPWRGLSGSESDYSDTENTGVVNKLQSYQSKVRHHSLSALYTILKVSESVRFTSWRFLKHRHDYAR